MSYDDAISRYAAQYNVPEALIRAIISVESSWNPKAKRYEPKINDTSYGLMQILTKTASNIWGKVISGIDLITPDFNIETGTKYLRYQLNRYGGNISAAVAAYNAGTAFPKKDGSGYVNQSYVDKVMNQFSKYQGTDGRSSLPSSGSGGDSPGSDDGSSGPVLILAFAALAAAMLIKKFMG